MSTHTPIYKTILGCLNLELTCISFTKLANLLLFILVLWVPKDFIAISYPNHSPL